MGCTGSAVGYDPLGEWRKRTAEKAANQFVLQLQDEINKREAGSRRWLQHIQRTIGNQLYQCTDCGGVARLGYRCACKPLRPPKRVGGCALHLDGDGQPYRPVLRIVGGETDPALLSPPKFRRDWGDEGAVSESLVSKAGFVAVVVERDQLDEKLADTRDELEKQQERAAQLVTTLGKERMRRAQLQDNVAELDKRLTASERQRRELAAHSDDLRQELEEAREECARLQEAHGIERNTGAKLVRERDDLQELLDGARNRAIAAENGRERLRRLCEQREAANDKLREKLRSEWGLIA